MTDANMICPGCKTFQPRAETCQKCGAIVAKLWAKDASPATSKNRAAPPADGGRSPLAVGAGVLAMAAVGFGLWSMLDPGGGDQDVEPPRPGLASYLEAARDAQHAADLSRERMEAAVYEAESGIAVLGPRGFPAADELDLDRDRLAAEINAVSRATQVQVTGADLQAAINQCAVFPRRYFKPLRFRAAESYPLPEPESEPYVAGALDGTYRCEGAEGTIYTNSVPRSQENLNACWKQQNPLKANIPGEKRPRRETLWVRMKWDAEAGRWAIYSRADQRLVDETRLREARLQYESDIKRMFGRREDRARERIPELVTTIETLQQDLAIAAGEDLRARHSRSLENAQQQLRKALVEHRYLWLCNSVASAALDAVEERVAGR